MNTQLRSAIDAVNQLHTLVARLAQTPISEATRLVQVEEDNREFLAAVNNAQLAVEAALDEVDGQALTKLDFAVDAVRRARTQYYTPVDGNRANALTCVEFAVENMNAGVRAL